MNEHADPPGDDDGDLDINQRENFDAYYNRTMEGATRAMAQG